MAVELVLRNWCDVCLDAGTNTPGETVSVVVTGTPAFDVEICPEHGAPLAAAVAALAALGRAPGKTGHPGRVRASKDTPDASSGRRRRTDDAPNSGGPCPSCDHKPFTTRAALRAHLRDEHDQSLADVGLAPVRFTCPQCGSRFDSGQGYGSHLRLRHDTSMAEIAAAS